ncbi:DUF6069 family protein [Actinomadura citrea]|uniref:Uncharacterized protein n=1 Tax=Actinomadura citrea TaxID=46158 RepID=A0A7Y9G654_9ACTN|nr:DUF6069 family protein [Actinomadura citrea]NYE10663.1 hypothetical protein [Actinomadura citrea]GGT74801.1 hypothetical protein GCM10010177_36050 [Actinomadura citrea]
MTSNVGSSGLGAVQAPMTAATTAPRTVPMWRAGLFGCVAAAAATTAVAAAGRGAGVPLEIDGEPIPLLGFTQLTLLFSAIGVLLALALRRWAASPRRTFLAATAVLTALSIVPDLIVSATVGTRLTLIAAHLVAASIVIPLVAARLPARTR